MKGNKKKILIVEDEAPMLRALSEELSHEGFEVLEAKDGKEGVDKAISLHPDLIIVDILLPVIDGLAMAKEIRKDEWGSLVPMIILTNLNAMEPLSEALASDITEYLVKTDWKITDISKLVKKKLNLE